MFATNLVTDATEAPTNDLLETAIARNSMGQFLREEGRAHEAYSMHTAALASLRSLGGSVQSNPKQARVLIQALAGAGSSQLALGRFEAAEDLLCEALSVAERALGPLDVEVAQSLNALGTLYKFWEKNDECLRCYGRALDVLLATIGRH